MEDPKHIIITGATSGIGWALAEFYAGSGVVLGLTGRNEDRLREVAALCANKGAVVDSVVLDVTNQAEMEEWITGFDLKYPVDLVVANAGISAGTGGVLIGEPADQVRHVLDVNLNGVLNTIEPLQQIMIGRGQGQIAILSSLAGYRGWPGAPAYCASKAAVKVYGEALRGALKGAGVQVNVVCPGFVVSRITAENEFPMPMIIKADKAAAIIARELRRNRGRISFPLVPSFMAWVVMIAPDFLAQRLLRSMPTKSINAD